MRLAAYLVSGWRFPPDEAKGKKACRVVYLTDRANEITLRLMARRPEGPLVRNRDGRPWHPYALNCRLFRLRLGHGRQRILQLGLMPPKIERLDATKCRDPAARAAHEEAIRRRRERTAERAQQHGTR